MRPTISKPTEKKEKTDSQEVIEVEKTVSPKILFGVPNERP